MPNFMLLQYASTLLGFVALAAWLLLWYRETAPVSVSATLPPLKSRASLGVSMLTIAIAAGLLRAWLLIGVLPRTIGHWDWSMLNFGVTAIAVAFWELLCYCLFMTLRQYAAQPAKVRVM